MAVKLRERLINTDTFTVGTGDIARAPAWCLTAVWWTLPGQCGKYVGITTSRVSRPGKSGWPRAAAPCWPWLPTQHFRGRLAGLGR